MDQKRPQPNAEGDAATIANGETLRNKNLTGEVTVDAAGVAAGEETELTMQIDHHGSSYLET